MLIAAIPLLAGSVPTVSQASVALRSSSRPALPVSAFPAGLSIADEKGAAVGKVVSVNQGIVTIRTQHALVRVPASAFITKGGPVMIGLSAAQLDALSRVTTPTK